MSELEKSMPSQAEMDDLLNPDFMSGRQLEILKKMDEKNVDRADLLELMRSFLDSYRSAVNGD